MENIKTMKNEFLHNYVNTLMFVFSSVFCVGWGEGDREEEREPGNEPLVERLEGTIRVRFVLSLTELGRVFVAWLCGFGMEILETGQNNPKKEHLSCSIYHTNDKRKYSTLYRVLVYSESSFSRPLIHRSFQLDRWVQLQPTDL